LKVSFPSPQVTPTPAAIERLEIDTLPEGWALSPEIAVAASTATNKNKTNLETVVIFDTGTPPFFGTQ
jgi:hypothetical protein